MYTPPTAKPEDAVGAVLFDLDGTLVITHIDFPAMRAGVITVAAAAGVDPQVVQGLDILAIIAHAAAHARARSGEDAARALTARAEAAMMAAELCGLEGATAAPYAGEVLETLAARKVRVGIVTRNCRHIAERELALAGLECSVMLTRNDVARCKPDPAHLLAALERLEVRPGAAVMVGDHTMDIEAGRAAGMRTVGVLDSVRPADFFHAVRPDLIVRDLRDLLPFVFGAS